MVRDERNEVLDVFIAELQTARRVAGSPSYGEIEVCSAALQGSIIAADLRVEMLTTSTVQRILTGHVRGLPKWRFVARLVFVLRDIAKTNGVDPDRVGTLTMWKARHEDADAAIGASTHTCHGRADRTPWQDACGNDMGIAVQSYALDLLCRFADTVHDRHRLRIVARETMTLDWWREYYGAVPPSFGAHLSLERGTSIIRTYETHFIPALLQTPAYAEAVVREKHPELPMPQVKRRQALWMCRQQILYRAEPVKLWAIIDEAALRAPVEPELMRGQIRHLVEMCDLPNVSVQVMPAGTVGHAVAGGPITLLRFPQREFPDVVYLEQLTAALYPLTRDDLHHYDKVLSRLGIEAPPPADSVEILHQILGQV
jgi:hypothetical protein